MLLVVGLGNPGRQYASHRHNVGFMAVGELATRARADAFRDKFSGSYAKAELEQKPACLLLPMTYMNASGQSVQPAAAFFKAAPEDIVVLHDELDLPFGEVRLKFGGGHAGHNGLRSIMACLGTGDFGRVRIGIGRPPAGFRGDVADYVLSSFDASERAELSSVLNRATESVLEVAARGFEAAMKTRNTREKPPKTQSKSSGPKDPESSSGC
jgi:PTH1 family peptidyl-tRNA hydrolase